MTLKLVMIRCPDNVAPERREVRGGEFSIGRGQDNEWVIPDPERHLSKRHCRLVYSVGDWQLHDLSANGTFLNRASEPVGKGASAEAAQRRPHQVRPLRARSHDRRGRGGRGARPRGLAVRPSSRRLCHARCPAVARRSPPLRRPRPRCPVARVRVRYWTCPIRRSCRRTSIPWRPIRSRSPATQPDHAPALESAFRPPQPVAIIPDDWDVAAPAGLRPQTARPPPPPQPASKTQPPRRHQGRSPPPRPPAAPDTGLAAAFLRGVGLSEARCRIRRRRSSDSAPPRGRPSAAFGRP